MSKNPIKNKIDSHKTANQHIQAATLKMSELYTSTRNRLFYEMQEAVLRGEVDTVRYQTELITAIQRHYSRLEYGYNKVFGKSIPYVAESFYLAALHDLGNSVIGEFDASRAKLMVKDAYTHVAGATANMLASDVSYLRSTASRVFGEAAMGNITHQDAANRLVDAFKWHNGTFRFVDAGGRVWNNEAYSKMLARTVLMNAGRQSYLETCIENGRNHVRVTISGNPCPDCAVWENRILAIVADDSGFPTIQEAQDGGLLHPNCTHSFVAVPESIISKRYDAEGRPLEGVNSAGNEEANDKDAWREYRKTSQYARDYASARSAIPARLAHEVDVHYTNLSQENKAVVYRYSNGDERNLNKSIRIGAELTTEQLHDIDRLSGIVADWPKYNGDVWRGMTFHSAKERYSFLSKIIRSEPITQFTSTSIMQDTPLDIINERRKRAKSQQFPVLMMIKNSKNGACIMHKSAKPGEKEILFNRALRLKKLDFALNDGILFITVEEV